jgi:hypothetical protein
MAKRYGVPDSFPWKTYSQNIVPVAAAYGNALVKMLMLSAALVTVEPAGVAMSLVINAADLVAEEIHINRVTAGNNANANDRVGQGLRWDSDARMNP